MPNISVIIPTFNRSRLLERTIRSVLSQTYRDFEIIIIDDASTDNTQEMLNDKFKQEIAAKMMRCFKNEINMERSYSRNYGMELAQGKYIAFLDDDDIWFPEHLAILSDYLNRKPEVGIVYSNHISLYENGSAKILNTIKGGEGAYYRDLCIRRVLSHNSMHLFRKSIYDRIGGFNVDISYGEDREFFSRIAMNHDVGYISSVTGCIYNHSGTYSMKETLEAHSYFKEKVWQLIEENSIKYRYPLSNATKADAYLFLSDCFLPNIQKTRDYFFRALSMDYRVVFRPNSWQIMIRILIGQKVLLLLKNIKNKGIRAHGQATLKL
jgi:glycosyltransferase involved in cell wall biosynthesis